MTTPSVQSRVSEQEWQLRQDLAACYRLVALYGWSDLVFTHISARIPGPEHHFLINPYGLMFDEITASSLVKVDQHCNKLIDSPYPVNPAGFVIHSAVHEAREDAGCVLHTHTRAGVAVSAQKDGVLPLSQQSTFVLASLAFVLALGLQFFSWFRLLRGPVRGRPAADRAPCTRRRRRARRWAAPAARAGCPPPWRPCPRRGPRRRRGTGS